jgi:hypothetical protein
MRKNLPLILIGFGVVVVLLAVFVVVRSLRKSTASTLPEPEEVVLELPQDQWPALTLTPVTDPAIPNSLGHLLNLKVQKLKVEGAATMDYLLVYSTSNGGQQGVPGTVQLTGSSVDKNLLLGSESSGKYRFDAGVDQGTITLTFRNGAGKSLGKAESAFHLQSETTTLNSIDGKFTYTLDKPAKGVWFVTMPTLVEPEASSNTVIWKDGYGVFSSDGKPHTGK